MLVKITLIAVMLSSPLLASDFGTYTEETKIRLAKERVSAIVSRSQATRSQAESARNIASITPQDMAWAENYDKLMSTETNTDYLKAALEL